jgi:hypothetical protein
LILIENRKIFLIGSKDVLPLSGRVKKALEPIIEEEKNGGLSGGGRISSQFVAPLNDLLQK